MAVELIGDEVEAESVLSYQLEALFRRRLLLLFRRPAAGAQFGGQPFELFDFLEQRHVRRSLMVLAVLLSNIFVSEKQIVKEDPVLDVGSLCHGQTTQYTQYVPLLKRFHKAGATIELNNPGATDLWIMKI